MLEMLGQMVSQIWRLLLEGGQSMAKHRPKMLSMRHVLGKWWMSNPNRLGEEAGARGRALPRGGGWFGAAR